MVTSRSGTTGAGMRHDKRAADARKPSRGGRVALAYSARLGFVR